MSRVKNDSQFPIKAITRCFTEAKVKETEITELAITSCNYPKYLLNYIKVPEKFSNEIRFHASKKFSVLAKIKKKLFTSSESSWFRKDLDSNSKISLKNLKNIFFIDHHLCHAACSLQASPFNQDDNHGVLVADGIGDGTSISLWSLKDGTLNCLKRWGGDFSLGWFYGICTEAFGWVHGTDEWKLMGLAAYGQNGKAFDKLDLFCPKPRLREKFSIPVFTPPFVIYGENGKNVYLNKKASKIKKLNPHKDENAFANKVQSLVENSFKELISDIQNEFKFKYMSFCGGFFLNVKNNQKLYESKLFEGIHISPDAGDSGLVLGSASIKKMNSHHGIHEIINHTNIFQSNKCLSPYLGTEYSNESIRECLIHRKIQYQEVDNPSLEAAKLLHKDKIIGWFQGKMEVGARALGNRSILANPSNPSNKDRVNSAIKYREGFRPFCPSMLQEDAVKYLDRFYLNEHMTCSFKAKQIAKDEIPAVVHIDGTCRIQIVTEDSNEKYFNLLKYCKEFAGIGVVLNTSFNIKGEPIVESPRQAIKCLFDTGLDALIIGNYLLSKD
jgi:carbamoyltransferase